MTSLQQSTAAHPTFSSRFAGQRRRRLVSLTPLIDVVFILLLFFMLASSFFDLHAISLDAPAAGASSSSLEGALLIEVRLDGVRIAGNYITLEQLPELAARRLSDNPDLKIVVQPGAGVNLQRTVRVLDRLANVGASHIALMGSGTSELTEKAMQFPRNRRHSDEDERILPLTNVIFLLRIVLLLVARLSSSDGIDNQ